MRRIDFAKILRHTSKRRIMATSGWMHLAPTFPLAADSVAFRHWCAHNQYHLCEIFVEMDARLQRRRLPAPFERSSKRSRLCLFVHSASHIIINPLTWARARSLVPPRVLNEAVVTRTPLHFLSVPGKTDSHRI